MMMTMLLVVLAVLTVVAAGEFVRSQCRRMIGASLAQPAGQDASAVAQLAD